MHALRRFAALISLGLLLVLAGCSGLTLLYQQLPLAASLWADRYLDLDGPQRQRLREHLRQWQAWHRREELPQWLALLREAHQALEGGVTREELLALEQGALASAERSLQQAAPLAAPVLASLRPAQWQHLQQTLDARLTQWREREAGADAAQARGERWAAGLARWLGDLDRPVRRAAQAEAARWQVDLPAQAQVRAARQARTLEALRAWAQQEHGAGVALLMRNLQPQPAELAYREQALAAVLRLLNGLDAGQREAVHRHWRAWERELGRLQSGG
ncbi:DUF6279 family lipoprotein [Pelomonas sp. UHG3]|uniref:DUF6279 family lipoprotein n=1 Tax=Roseateles hydrophilus TaxID=2975054 RepID=A0ACC6CF59_9BURK|nr:DUF6279 family lipoprotein [Pelomonas sp. UHG3]MCY4746915.1 DUF6279 family lipoprotein [Pelomonas sp. UHG3]